MTARGRHVTGVTLYRPDPVTFARHRARHPLAWHFHGAMASVVLAIGERSMRRRTP